MKFKDRLKVQKINITATGLRPNFKVNELGMSGSVIVEFVIDKKFWFGPNQIKDKEEQVDFLYKLIQKELKNELNKLLD